VFNLVIHTNYTPIGRKTPEFPGGIIPDRSVNGAFEWAYGVTDWFEQGLYLPVWTPYSRNHGGSIDAFKLRELFVRPHAAEHKFFYGVNFEFSVNRLYWEPGRITSEIRANRGRASGQDGFHLESDCRHRLHGRREKPRIRSGDATRVQLEQQVGDSSGGVFRFRTAEGLPPIGDQFHEVWAVFDHAGKVIHIEAGAGLGVTGGADRLTLKLMVSRPQPEVEKYDLWRASSENKLAVEKGN
jgi:hypothetical protein